MSERPFGEVVRDALIERGIVTAIGNPNWSHFSNQLDGVSYETLRKAVTRERPPSAKVMQEVAAALDVSPDSFVEWRLDAVRRSLDVEEVGFEKAVEALRRIEAADAS